MPVVIYLDRAAEFPARSARLLSWLESRLPEAFSLLMTDSAPGDGRPLSFADWVTVPASMDAGRKARILDAYVAQLRADAVLWVGAGSAEVASHSRGGARRFAVGFEAPGVVSFADESALESSEEFGKIVSRLRVVSSENHQEALAELRRDRGERPLRIYWQGKLGSSFAAFARGLPADEKFELQVGLRDGIVSAGPRGALRALTELRGVRAPVRVVAEERPAIYLSQLIERIVNTGAVS